MIYTVSGQLDSLLTGMQLACFPAVAVAIAITIASAPATIAVLWSYNKYSCGHHCVFVLVCTGALIAADELYMLKAFDTKSVAVSILIIGHVQLKSPGRHFMSVA